jgi:hypothetical protein
MTNEVVTVLLGTEFCAPPRSHLRIGGHLRARVWSVAVVEWLAVSEDGEGYADFPVHDYNTRLLLGIAPPD